MRPTMRLATRPPNKHRTLFIGEQLALFFCDGSTSNEGEIVFYNDDFSFLSNEQGDISGEYIFQETSEWQFLESVASVHWSER